MFGRRLPRATDPGDAKVLDDIRTYGFHAKHVRPDAHPHHAREKAEFGPHPILDIGISYTVGLPYSHRHAELAIVTGMASERAHAILWAVVQLIQDGANFAVSDESGDVLVDLSVRFGAISRAWRKELLTFSDWAARRKDFAALQLLLPDAEGHFPSDVGYAGPPQPLLV